MQRGGGFGPWLLQRISAVIIGVYVVYAGIHLLLERPQTYQAWQSWMGSLSVNIATGLFFMALLVHAWVGVRDVIMDYVKPVGLRVLVNTLVIVTLAASGLRVVQVLGRIAG